MPIHLPLVLQILLPIAVGVVCAVIAFIAGSNHRKHTAEAEIGSAEQEAKRLVNEATICSAACFRFPVTAKILHIVLSGR